MPGEDLFKRYLEMGASVLGMSRERAESIVKDLVASGEVARGQAAKAADWLVERGRAGADELSEVVRREVRQQVAALGLATKEDLDRLEARLAAVPASGTGAATTGSPPTATKARAAKPATGASKAAGDGAGTAAAGGGKVAGGTEKAAAVPKKAATATGKAARGPAKPATAAKKAVGTKKVGAPDSTVTEGEGAGITRSASVRRRPGRSGSGEPDAAPPAGGAVPPKG